MAADEGGHQPPRGPGGDPRGVNRRRHNRRPPQRDRDPAAAVVQRLELSPMVGTISCRGLGRAAERGATLGRPCENRIGHDPAARQRPPDPLAGEGLNVGRGVACAEHPPR